MNAVHARIRFRLRTLENLAIVAVAFSAIAVTVSNSPLAWIIDFAAMGILYFVFVYALERRAIEIECPHCAKHIVTNIPWICGFCQKLNENGDEFPFVHKCKACGAEPRAYKCHHRGCSKLIFLGRDELEANFARCVNAPAVELETPAITETEAEKRSREMKDIEHETMLCELNAKLNAAKERAEMAKKKTPKERLEKSFESHHSTTMGAREIARAKRKEMEEKYKDDPEMLKDALDAIDDWLAKEI